MTQRTMLFMLTLMPTFVYAGIGATPVPEPGIITLFAAGSVAIVLISKYRKK
jgi:hypothetical protein